MTTKTKTAVEMVQQQNAFGVAGASGYTHSTGGTVDDSGRVKIEDNTLVRCCCEKR